MALSQAQNLKRPLLSEAIAETLSERIFSGQLKGGERLQGATIAAEFSTSQAPVREALSLLESRGLATSEAFRGFRVVKLEMSDVEDILQLRICLDSIALSRAIEAISEAEIHALALCVTEMLRAADSEDLSALAKHDIAFHTIIASQSSSHTIRNTWSAVESQFRLASSESNRLSERSYLARIARMHLPILQAIENRDIAAAQRANEAHLRFAFDKILHTTLSVADDEAMPASRDNGE